MKTLYLTLLLGAVVLGVHILMALLLQSGTDVCNVVDSSPWYELIGKTSYH